MARPIYCVYIADGFADDCDELIQRCSRVDILSYQTFCIYYKDMNFASIFQGRTSNAEIAELSEELLQVAKHYMVKDTSNFEESVAGLFLVYALLNLQPYPRFAPLRIVPTDLPALSRIEQVARREKRFDVLYVMGSILVRGPVQYHAVARERGLEGSLRKYLEGSCTADATGLRPKGVYFRQNEELDIIREMTGIFKKYAIAKEQIPGFKTRGLKYSNDNLANDLGSSLKRLISGVTEEEATAPRDHLSAVQEIKLRAMRGSVGAMRHLSAVAQRSPEKSPQKKIETTTSPSTPTSKATPKRAKPRPRPQKHKRLKRGDTEDCVTSESEDFSPKKGIAANSISEESTDEMSEQEIQVQFESLPTIVNTESEGRQIEIQVIDKMKKKKGRKKKTDDAVFKKPRTSPRIKKLTKREMKKPLLKSKFKKMGMLPVANFEEK